MSFDVDFGGVEANDLDGFPVFPPGQHHFGCLGCKEITDNESRIIGLQVELSCLASTEAAAIGGSHRESFFFRARPDAKNPKWPMQRLGRLLYAMGIAATKEAIVGYRGALDPLWFQGRQFIAVTDINEYKGKKNAQIVGLEMYRLDDPAMSHVPRDHAMADAYLNGSGSAPNIGAAADFAGV